ncbi:MAG: hypothetical protein ACAH35_03460 [Candidatus Paceibacterota bacterium]
MLLSLQGTITAIENLTAVLTLDDNQTIRFSLKEMDVRPQVGDTYVLHLLPESEAKLSTDELARSLLSQLIRDVPAETNQAKIEEGTAA